MVRRPSCSKYGLVAVFTIAIFIFYHATGGSSTHLPASLRRTPTPAPSSRAHLLAGLNDDPSGSKKKTTKPKANRVHFGDVPIPAGAIAVVAVPGAPDSEGGLEEEDSDSDELVKAPPPPADPRELGFKEAKEDEDERDNWVPVPGHKAARPPKLSELEDEEGQEIPDLSGKAPVVHAVGVQEDEEWADPLDVEDLEEDGSDTPVVALGGEDELDDLQGDKNRAKGSVNKIAPPFRGRKGAAKAKPKKVAAKPGKQGAVKWEGAGWSARFKGTKLAAGIDDPLNPRPDAPVAAKHDAPPPPSGFLAHPLVARFAAFDFTRHSSSSKVDPLLAVPPHAPAAPDAAAEPAAKPRPVINLTPPKYNLTLCALIPAEQRFLPEWLLYHSFLGVERFALYDTSAAGAVGAEEIDGLADQMEEEGKGESAPKAAEIKAGIGRTTSGLDAHGKVWPQRIAGLERWIEQDVVTLHWMKFQDAKKARSFHSDMIDHCSRTYSSSSNYIAHLDVDEFIILSESLYGTHRPYQEDSATTALSWRYPLHDFLERTTSMEAACIPIPQLRYRNIGVRTLAAGQGVLATQTRRDVVDSEHRDLPEKVLLHPAYTSDFVYFDGPHSCRVDQQTPAPKGVTKEIRNSQGEVIQTGGVFKSTTRLPTEPLAIAHFFQRDLSDCHQKMGLVADPNSLHSKGRGTVSCEELYLPSQAELASPAFVANVQNRFLVRVPEEGSVIEDLRARDSWAAKATAAILSSWNVKGAQVAVTQREIELAQDKVVLLLF